MIYWQIGCGSGGRDFNQVCLDFGVALVGPGDIGNYYEHREAYAEWQEAEDKVGRLARMKKGERIVLRKGKKAIKAVGEIIGEYDYSNQFSDIDGWDLQHFVKVKWKDIAHIFSNAPLGATTVQHLRDKRVTELIENLWEKSNFIKSTENLVKIVEKRQELKESQIEESLINSGISIKTAEEMTRTIIRVKKLGMWYNNTKSRYSAEHEIRTFLVIPFFQSLGWPAQKIAIELAIQRKKIDIVLYKDADRQNPIALVETKKIDSGLEHAYWQLLSYVDNFPSVEYLITTTGLRYALYEKRGNDWTQTAYINFNKMSDRHCCYPDIKGVTYFIEKLLP